MAKQKPTLPSIEQPAAAIEDQSAVAVLDPPAAVEVVVQKSAKPQPAADDLVRRVVNMQADLLAAAELVCIRLAKGETVNDAAMIFSALRWDQRRIETEVGRLRSVIELQSKAGSDRQLESAKAVLAEREKTVPGELAAIEAKIAELQADVASKRSTLNLARNRVETMQAARVSLRGKVPTHVFDAYNRLRGAITSSPLAVQTREANSRVRMIQSLLAGGQSEEDKVRHFEAIGRPDLISRTGHAGHNGGHTMIIKKVSDAAWQGYCNELRVELPTLEKLVAEAEPILTAQIAELEAGTLDLYILKD